MLHFDMRLWEFAETELHAAATTHSPAHPRFVRGFGPFHASHFQSQSTHYEETGDIADSSQACP